MRNPLRTSQLVRTTAHSIQEGESRWLKPWQKGLTGALFCALFIGGISLAALGHDRAAKSGSSSDSTASASGDSSTPASGTAKNSEAAKEKAATSKKAKGSAKAGSPAKGAAAAKPPAQQNTATLTLNPPKSNKSSSADGDEDADEESPDSILARERWFHDQRAYPFKHIPAGAFQKALQQRDAMAQRQRQANAGKLNAQGIITFPGNGLWQLMGPQPINVPFDANGGSPTASGRITAVAVDTTDATGQTVYVGGAAGGVWKTTNGGTTWTPLTDSQPSLAVGSITIDPNSNLTVYVGTGEDDFNIDGYYGAGILKSTDGGNTWKQLGASSFVGPFSPGVGGAQIGAIAVQPGNSSVVLAAVDFFDGNDPNGGIWRSTDGGTTWVRPTTGAAGSAGTGVVFDPGTPANVYAALGDIFSPAATANGIWKSTDGGNNWTKLGGGLPTTNVGRITLGYAASTTGATATIYAAIADASTNSSNLLGLYKTTTGGSTWSQVTAAPTFCNSQCFYDIAVGVSPTNANLVVLGGGAFTDNLTSLFQSTNGGTSWTSTGAGSFTNGTAAIHPHVDTHAIVFTPAIAANGGNPTLYVGNDGGMWKTLNPTVAPPTWVDLNNAGTAGQQLAITQFYPGISAGIGDENYGFGGTQDNDTEYFSGTLAWTSVAACGDGGFTAIDTTYPSTIYTACNSRAGTKVAESVFNGQITAGPNSTWFQAESEITASGDRMIFIPPLIIDQNNPAILYFGTCRLWQTTNAETVGAAPTWAPITGDLSATNTPGSNCPSTASDAITSMDVAHQSDSIVFAATSNGKVWRSTSATLGVASTWTEIDGGLLPSRYITAVRSERSDSTGNIAFVTFSGFGSCAGCDGKGHVFATTNGGTAWSDISGDLPDIPVNDLIVDHEGSPVHDALYIATDVGVFSCETVTSATPCTNWTVIGDGLPNSPVLSLAMRRSSRILRAATHGRSMWQVQLTDVMPPAIASLSSLTPAVVSVGAATTNVTVTGVNFSSNSQVLLDGISTGVTTTFVSTTQLTVSINSALLANGIVYNATVTDPAGADTGSQPFTVMNPVPTVSGFTISPAAPLTNDPITLVFNGSGFVAGTVVTLNGLNVVGGTPSSGGTVFTITISGFENLTAGSIPLTLYNPLPGGGLAGGTNITIGANPLTFSPNPIILGPINISSTTPVLNVSITNSGTTAVTISAQSLTGTNAANFNFAAPTAGTTCNFPTSGQSGSGSIVLAASGGTCNFGIQFFANPATGNVDSLATLNVTDTVSDSPQHIQVIGELNNVAGLVTLSPVAFGGVAIGTTSPTMNSTLFNLNSSAISVTSAFSITGANLADFHLVPFVASGDGNAGCATTVPFVLNAFTACDVTLTFTPSLPASSETATLNVTTSASGTPATAALTGTGIELTSISPAIVASGGPAFTLTVNGGGFASSAIVSVNGSARLTTFVSATQLLASIPASDIATAGSLAITVTTPNPGGTPSEPKTLIVAQAPSATNDNVNYAVNATPTPFRLTQDTTHATAQTTAFTGNPATPIDPTPCASGSTAKSVWFQFTAPASGKVVADTRFSTYTTLLSSWTISAPLPSSTATFTPVACNTANVPAQGSAPAASLITFPVSNGTTYYIMVTDPAGVGGTLTFSLDFSSAAPANDDNAAPTTITPAQLPYTNTVNSIEATANTNGHADPTPPCTVGAAGLVGTGQSNSVWYTFTPTSSGTIVADTLTSPYETILNVTSGTPTGTQVACNQSAGSGVAQSQVSFSAASGTQYFFMVSAFLGDGGTTNFHLAFTAGGVGPAAKLAFSQQPTNVAAGSPITPAVTVTVQDASGNTVTTATNQVTIAIGTNPSGGTLSGTLTGTPVNGVVTFSNLSINKVGTGYTLTAAATGLTGATSSAFNVTVGAPAQLAFSQQPTNVAAGASITPAVTVTVQDAGGNTVTTATNSVSIAIGTNPSGGTLSGTVSGTPTNGVVTFSTLSINKAGTGYTLNATSTGLTGTTSTAFNVTPGAANKLVFTQQPTNVASGAAITPAVTVTVEDAQGNTVTSATNTVNIAIGTNPSGGTLSGTLSGTPTNGVVTFSTLSINNAGTGYTLSATSTGLTGATSTAFNVTTGGAAKLVFSQQPTNVAAGASITPAVTVTVEDASGNVVTSATNTVNIAIGTNPSGGTLSGTLSGTPTNGVVTFSTLSINKVGTGYTLSATSTGLTAATSTAFNVTPGAANKLVFTQQPTNVASGASITPAVTVTVEDASGNVVTSAANTVNIAIGTNPSGGTLSGTLSGTPTNGVVSFSTLSINKAGTGYTLAATSTGLTGATSTAFNVTPGAATQLIFSQQPTNVAAGASITPAVAVTVEDAAGNVVTSAANTVNIAIGTNPSAGTLSGTLSGTPTNGVVTFSTLSINKTGTGYTLAATSTGLTGATSTAFNVTPGAANKLVFTQQPTNVAAGASITPAVTVTVQDAQGNTVTTAANTVNIAIGTNPSGGTLSGTLSGTPTNGVVSFSTLSINKVGAGYTLSATSTGLTAATSTAFNVTPGAAAQLIFSQQPTNVAAGASITPAVAVTVEDAAGNIVTGANNTVNIAIGTNPSGGTLSGTLSGTPTNGVVTFSTLSINKTGTGYTLAATSTGLTGATSSAFNVTPGAANKLVFTQQPTNVGAGSLITPAVTVTVQDAQGNTVTGANNIVNIAIGTNPAGGTLSGTVSGTPTNGVVTFSTLSINNAGTGYTLAATSTGLTGATSSAFNVTSGTPAKLAFTVQPSNVGSGSSITPAVVVAVQDAQGNTVTSATNTVNIAIGTNPAGGTLSGTLSGTPTNGLVTFSNLSINNLGTGYTLSATSTGLTTATSNAFNVTSGTPAKLVFSAQPSNVVVGASIAPAVTVTVEDAQGNVVTSASNTVTIAIGTNPSGGTLSGTLSGTPTNGVVTFSTLSINKVGTGYTLTAGATGLTGATSNAFNVTPGAASKLVFTQQPTNVVAGVAIAPAVTVTVQDAQGNTVTNANNTVNIVIGTNPSGGTLSGTLSGTPTNGVVTFSNLSINKVGTGYTLAASATGLTGATSSAFNVTAAAAASLVTAAGTPQSVAIDAAFPTNLQVSVTDAFGNGVSGVLVTFAINPAASGASGAFAGGVNTATTNASGVATAAVFTANGTVGSYTVVATATGVPGSATFNLTNLAGAAASITASSGTPQTVQVGTAFATLKALVKDAGGNPVSGANVTFTAPGTGASGAFTGATNVGSATTDATGTASAPVFTANFTNGNYTVNATVSGVAAPAPFSLTNTASTPALTTLSPASATVNAAPFTLTVNGSNFTTTSVVSFNGVNKTTTFVNANQLTAPIATADLATAGTVNVSVVTPAPGGGGSGSLPFTINNPGPTITSLSPSSATAGGNGFPLNITGTNFVAASQVTFNGGLKPTTFVSATQLTATISAGDIATAGILNVTVTNPPPGGGTSAPPAQFTVNNVQPTLTTLSPASTLAGGPPFTLTVNGQANSFVTGAIVSFNGSPRTTNFVNSSQVTANITVADIAKAGTFNVTVTNPAPAVGPSVALTFNVNNPVPTITGATAGGQNHVAAGAAFTLTVTGTNFVSTSVISFGTKAETTTLVSATQITASVPAADANTAGPVTISVNNPAPGGGPTPTSVTFTLDGYSLAGPASPVTVTAGQTATIPIVVTPSANGFGNSATFSVTGLPAHSSLVPLNVTPGNAKTTFNVMIMTTADSAAPPVSPTDRPLPPLVRFLLVSWLVAFLAGIYFMRLLRRAPRFRRYAAVIPLALLLLSVGVIGGCASLMKGTPKGSAPLSIVLTSGSFSQSTSATLTVQ